MHGTRRPAPTAAFVFRQLSSEERARGEAARAKAALKAAARKVQAPSQHPMGLRTSRAADGATREGGPGTEEGGRRAGKRARV